MAGAERTLSLHHESLSATTRIIQTLVLCAMFACNIDTRCQEPSNKIGNMPILHWRASVQAMKNATDMPDPVSPPPLRPITNDTADDLSWMEKSPISLAATKCSIIVTHHNYGSLIGNALRSVLDQTHRHFQCIVVDDASRRDQVNILNRTVQELQDERINVAYLKKNVGQTLAVFEGLKLAEGDFIAILDPDDLYEPDFLETLLRAHLNPLTIAALAACEMGIFRVGQGALSRDTTGFRRRALAKGRLRACELNLAESGFSMYYPPWEPGWHWATTSGLMFRRDALELIRPTKFPSHMKISADAYCAHGAHIIGGTLFVDKLLSWRGVHASNSVRVGYLFNQDQVRLKEDFIDHTNDLKKEAINSFFNNGGHRFLPVASLGELMTTHFSSDELNVWMQENDAIRKFLVQFATNASWDIVDDRPNSDTPSKSRHKKDQGPESGSGRSKK